MKNNTKNIRKGITAALFAAIMMVSVLAVVSPVQANTGGVLYAGGSNPGYVYKYTGGTSWDVISPDLVGYAVLDLVEYDGHLYAGIESSSSVGQVYRYDGGTIWTLVGNNMDSQICSLAVYQDDLYAGTGWNGMKLYKYEGGHYLDTKNRPGSVVRYKVTTCFTRLSPHGRPRMGSIWSLGWNRFLPGST